MNIDAVRAIISDAYQKCVDVSTTVSTTMSAVSAVPNGTVAAKL